jgi:hypothetical protein
MTDFQRDCKTEGPSMSQTTITPSPQALATTDTAVNGSSSTVALVNKAAIDPVVLNTLLTTLLSLVGDRSLLGTKTFWVTLLTPLVTWGAGLLAQRLGVSIDSGTIGGVACILGALAAWIMKRYFNSGARVTSVLPQSKTT